jgi:hypothetical protein
LAAARASHRLLSPVSVADREFDLLVACCCGAGKSDVAAKGGVAIDWKRLLSLADRHRVFPAVYAALDGHPEVPANAQSMLHARFQTNARQTVRLAAELTGILRAFENSRIEVLPHKGPALAKILFDDPGMRQFGDLDFLIRPQDVSRARIVLRGLGYQPKLQLSKRQETAYLRSGYEYPFGCDQGANLIELQWQIVPFFYSIGFDMDSLFLRSVETEWEGRRIRVTRNEDLLLLLCVHAAKHEWSQLGMIRDISRLASREVEWNWIKRESDRLGIRKILSISLLLAHKLLHCQLANTLMSSDEIAEKLADTFQLKFVLGEEHNPESLRYFWAMMRLRERWRDRIRVAWRLAATPNVGEWKSLKIPDSLFPFYRGVRAMRLARRACHAGQARKPKSTGE